MEEAVINKVADAAPPASPVRWWHWVCALLLTLLAVDVAGYFGSEAMRLGIPGASFVWMMAPVGVFLSMVCLPLLLPRWRTILSIALAMGFVVLPYALLSGCSTRFPLNCRLTSAEIEALRRVLGVPMLVNDEGPSMQHLRIRTVHATPAVRGRLQAWLADLPPSARMPQAR